MALSLKVGSGGSRGMQKGQVHPPPPPPPPPSPIARTYQTASQLATSCLQTQGGGCGRGIQCKFMKYFCFHTLHGRGHIPLPHPPPCVALQPRTGQILSSWYTPLSFSGSAAPLVGYKKSCPEFPEPPEKAIQIICPIMSHFTLKPHVSFDITVS